MGDQVLPLINADYDTLRVPAGPGTGKTFGLRRRVLRLLHPQGLAADPSSVLVCTFNRVIANELRGEIDAELAPHGLVSPAVRTVHGLAASLAGEIPRFLLPHELEAMVYDIRTTHPEIDEAYDRRQPRVLRALREHEAGRVDDPALGTAVREWLTAHGAALVGDLPRTVEARLRGGEFGSHRYRHIIIDEFQDLTEVEARLVLGLRAPGGSVVALGDRKQSIYAFRGNEGRGLDALPELVGDDVADHRMDECQRCPSEIVHLANALMAIYREPLRDVRGRGGEVHQVYSRTPESEHRCMAAEIARVARARPGQRHLVLVTRRQWGYDLREAIRQVDPDLVAQTVFTEDILETWPAREAFIFLSLLGDPEDAATARDWIAYQQPDADGKHWKAPWRNAPAYAFLRNQRGVLNLERALEVAQLDEQELAGRGRRNVLDRLRRLMELLGDVPDRRDIGAVVRHVLDPHRWIDSQTASADLASDDIRRLLREAEKMLEEPDPDRSLNSLVQRLRLRIATREPLGRDEEAAIKIVTLWGAKGLTADFVYVVGLCDEALPGPYNEDSTGLTREEHELEQLRLLYVSLTRAKQSLVISRPQTIRRGKVPALGLIRRSRGSRYWQDLRQCRFFRDIPAAALPDAVDCTRWAGIGV